MTTKKEVADIADYDRKGFEMWAKAENFNIEFRVGDNKRGRAGMYEETATQSAWDGWRAAKGYVAPKPVVNIAKLKIKVERVEEDEGDWSNDLFDISLNGEKFAYGNFFLEDDSVIPFNWSLFSTTSELADEIGNQINFSGLDDAKNPKQAVSLVTKQMKAWVKTPKAKKVLEHFFKWNETGTHATRLKSL